MRIIERSVDLASLEGLEGLTIGRLAGELGPSKSGLLGHFGTKEALQLAALEEASAIFSREVWHPVSEAPPGLKRLRATCASWISYLERGVFPGGCLFTTATFEYDSRSGPVRALLRRQFAAWRRRLAGDIRTAVARGELPAASDPDQIVFELNGIMMSLNHAWQLYGDTTAVDRAHRAVARVLEPEGVEPEGVEPEGVEPEGVDRQE